MSEPKYKIGQVIMAYDLSFFETLFNRDPKTKRVFKIGHIDIYSRKRYLHICYRKSAWSSGVSEEDVIKIITP